MRSIFVLLLSLTLLATSGCKPKAKDIPPLQRKEAASLASEAQFAVVLRDHARAEPLFEKAAKLCPDTGEYWLGLGVARRRQNNLAGAKAAYEQARSAYHDAYAIDPAETEALMQELYVLCLLGKKDEAQKTFEKAYKKDPNNGRLRSFAESKQLEKLFADTSFKDLTV
ncbi:MAG TPA: tetratricopeptide repeat protein [Longimicrobiales bacterium]|nr:tetratricopeptide repeat protein [Longimicrobiales bacterium]